MSIGKRRAHLITEQTFELQYNEK
uniref:Uncharacterized protein n=1 Tax=Anguilla anguilla TaxID=7936 RepID=A0A0E9RX87_ANGAN